MEQLINEGLQTCRFIIFDAIGIQELYEKNKQCNTSFRVSEQSFLHGLLASHPFVFYFTRFLRSCLLSDYHLFGRVLL